MNAGTITLEVYLSTLIKLLGVKVRSSAITVKGLAISDLDVIKYLEDLRLGPCNRFKTEIANNS